MRPTKILTKDKKTTNNQTTKPIKKSPETGTSKDEKKFQKHPDYKKLLALNPQSVETIPRKGELLLARLVKIVDGDTIDVIMLLGEHPLRIRIRLLGLDAPETKQNRGCTALEKIAGLKVKGYVCSKLDKYGGRYVGTIKHPKDNITLNDHLIEMKYVKIYNGGKKNDWSDAELNDIINAIKL